MRTNKRVSAVVVRDGKILLIHRKKNGDEYWVVVGGGVEDNETVEAGLVREVKEETSLDLIKHLFLEKMIDENGKEHHFYLCELSEGEPVLGGPEAGEHCEDNWYNLEWVEKEKLMTITAIYPRQIMKMIDKIFTD